MVESCSIERLTEDLIKKHFLKISEMYFENIKSHQFTNSMTLGDAKRKIADLQDYIIKELAIAYICINKSDTCCGFIWAYPNNYRDNHRMYISVVQVEGELRGKGIGTKLMNAVESEAINLGFNEIYIHTEASNFGARKLYERNGYCDERVQLSKNLK